MKIKSMLGKKVITVILILTLILCAIFLAGIRIFGHHPDPAWRRPSNVIEHTAVKTLSEIYRMQEEFKDVKIKDQNHNGIGEYATIFELVRYTKENEKYKNDPWFVDTKNDNLPRNEFDYIFQVFLPPQVDEQEKYWLCLSIPGDYVSKGSYRRSYFLDNKRDIIFYAEKSSLEKLNGLDRWSPKKIFCGEPFKSPIDTSRWKILERNLRAVGK